MKRLLILAVLLVSACGTIQPSDPYAELCRPESERSCPSDTNAPILLTGTPDDASAAGQTDALK